MNDLRLPFLGCAAWVGALLGVRWPGLVLPVVLACAVIVGVAALLPRLRRGRLVGTVVAATLLLGTVGWSGTLRAEAEQAGPVAGQAARGSTAELVVTVASDPRPSRNDPELFVLRARVHEVTAGGASWTTRAQAVLLADRTWQQVPLGARVRVRGRLVPADGRTSALVRVRSAPEVLAAPAVWWRAAGVVRDGIRKAVAHRPPDEQVLVPSLVVGDDAGLDPALVDDFAATGLTHLTAVSGTNLTLLVGALLVGARWAGVRGRGTYLVAGLGIVGFILLARTEPSVVRAATMGSVALVSLGSNGRQRGLRSLGAAVVVLLLWEPAMAVQVGFALSVLATSGILLLAPDWRDALGRWMPRRVAEAVAVPAAAQLACTPVVAGISGEVSLAAVLANLLVTPAVAPATVLGLLGGCLAVVWPALGQVVGTPAAWSVAWIIAVARWGAGLPTPALSWGTGAGALSALVLVAVLLVLLLPRLLARPLLGAVLVALGVGGAFLSLPGPAWPPPGWVAVACDVGQGDALVLRAAEGQAVVVDAGPDPRPVDACLDRLGVRAVPLLVLTHFHADHTDGVAGVLDDREVGEVQVSPGDRSAGSYADESLAVLAARAVPVTPSEHLATSRVGDLTLQRLWPPPGRRPGGGDDPANDASVVLWAEVEGVTFLLTGDVEPSAQRGLLRLLGETRVDVLKVPHHGSRHQDHGFLRSAAPRVSLVSAGADNTYGHPDPGVLDLLETAGSTVWRTDRHGDVAVVVRDGEVGVVPRG